MSLFEYLAVLVSIIIGFGVTQILAGFSRVVHTRFHNRIYWVQLAWACGILMWMIAFWWFTFALSVVETWTYGLYLFIILYSTLLYTLVTLLFPHDPPPDQDYEAHFYVNRKWFFGTLFVFALVDLIDFWIKIQTGSGIVGLVPYLLFIGPIIILSVVASFVESRRFHAGFAIMFLVWVTAFSFMSLTPMGAG